MFCSKILSTSFPLKSRTTTINPLHFSLLRKPSYNYSYTRATIGNGVFPLSKTFIQRRLSSSSSSRRGLLLVAPCTGENRGPEEEDDYSRRALETVFKLYAAVKNRNLHELSDILGDECSCVSNFFSSFQPSYERYQLLYMPCLPGEGCYKVKPKKKYTRQQSLGGGSEKEAYCICFAHSVLHGCLVVPCNAFLVLSQTERSRSLTFSMSIDLL